MDRSVPARIIWFNFIAYCLLTMTSFGFKVISGILFDIGNPLAQRFFQFGFFLGGIGLIAYPIITVAPCFIISVIGIIRSRKPLLYLLCPVIEVALWLSLQYVYRFST